MKPVVATAVILHTIGVWTDFVNPQIILGPPSGLYTVTTGVYAAIGQKLDELHVVYPNLLLAVAPVLVVLRVHAAEHRRRPDGGSDEGMTMQRLISVTASTPTLPTPPGWAVLQRRLFDAARRGLAEFEPLYCAPDGASDLRRAACTAVTASTTSTSRSSTGPCSTCSAAPTTCSAACKTALGRRDRAADRRSGSLTDEFERGYDWFHQGESLLFFYALCAADPRRCCSGRGPCGSRTCTCRTRRSATTTARARMIGAPHNGAGGPRWGSDEEWAELRRRAPA